jgi:hypothetical protein
VSRHHQPIPTMGAGHTDEDEWQIDPVGDFQLFAMSQPFTLDKTTLPAPLFLDLLDAVIQRETDDRVRLRAMRMAAAVVYWVCEEFQRIRFGIEPIQAREESEEAGRDPRQVEIHLILAASLAFNLGDGHFPRIAARWLGIGGSLARLAAYYCCIESWNDVAKILQQEAPATYLRVLVGKRIEENERIRSYRARGNRVLSLDGGDLHVAECGVEAPTPFMTNLLEILRARPGKKVARLASIIERMREGYRKCDLGADYQYLRDNVPMLVKMVNGVEGINRQSSPGAGARGPVSTQPWIVERIAGVETVAHRYHGRELDVYGALLKKELEALLVKDDSSYFSRGSVPGE